mgnify:CR=1 FL=1
MLCERPGKHGTIPFTLQRDTAIRAKLLVLLNHFHKRCFACGAISTQNRDVPAYFKIKLDFLVLYNDSICSYHKASSHIKSGNRNKLFHRMDDLIRIQDTNRKRFTSKVHKMAEVNSNIFFFCDF